MGAGLRFTVHDTALRGKGAGTINKHEIKRNKKYATIGRRLIRERDDLAELRDSGCKIAYLSSQEEKKEGKGTKLICGTCKKVDDNLRWIIPYDMLITVYEPNVYYFTDKQLEILIWHELKHIGVCQDSEEAEFYIVPHDYEEFSEIIKEHGLDWAMPE
jgi:hypothetical protein